MEVQSFEDRQKQSLKKRLENYIEFQKHLKSHVINKYYFDVHILDPKKQKINTDRGMFISAYVSYKGVDVTRIEPDFHDFDDNINELRMFKSSFDTIIESINFSRENKKLEPLEFKKRKFGSLQQCLDECKRKIDTITEFFTNKNY